MSDVISRLNLILDATVAPFVNAFQGPVVGALNTFKSAVSSAVSSLTTLTGFSAGLAAVGGTAGIGLLLKSQLEAIETSAHLADRLGLTTRSLATFSYAARQAGIDQDTFARGASFLEKSIAKAAINGGELAEQFNRIGLNANALSGLQPEETIARVADAIKAIQNPYERAAAAAAIFGKQAGQEMLPLMLEGGDAMRAAAKDADALGLSFNRVDAEKVLRAQQSLGKVIGVFQGMARQVGIILAPYIEMLNNSFVATGVKAIAAVKTYLPKVIDYIRLTWARIIASYEFLKPYVVAVWRYVADMTIQVWQRIYNFVAPYVTSIADWIKEKWTTIVETTIGLGVAIYNVLSETFLVAWEIVKVVAAGVATAWKASMDYLFGSTVSAGMSVGKAIQTIGEWTNWLVQKITVGSNIAAYAIAHLQETWALLSAGVQYYAVMIGNWLKWAFTEVPRAVFAWFSSNWRAVFSDIYNYSKNILGNIGTNFTNLWATVSSLGKTPFNWTSLTAGFTSSVQQLPQIAEREIGPLEKNLKEKFGALAGDYTKGLNTYLDEQAKKTGDLTGKVKSAVDWIKDQFNKPSTIKIDPIKPPEVPTPQMDIDVLPAFNAIDRVQEKANKLDLIHSGSAESLRLRAVAFADSIRFDGSFTGGSNAKPPQPVQPPQAAPIPPSVQNQQRNEQAKVEDMVKKIVELITKGNGSLDKIASNTAGQDVIYSGA